MSGFSPLTMNSGRRNGEEHVDEDNSDCEVDGSFIILPNNHSVASSPQTNENVPCPGINLNVFQLGQQQLSVSNQCQNPQSETEVIFGSMDTVTDGSFTESSTTENAAINPPACEPEPVIANHEETLESVISNMSSCSTDSTASFEEANSKVLQLLEENMGLKVFVRELNEKQRKFLENCKVLECAVAKSKLESQEQERKYDRSRSVIETLRAKVSELELKTGSPKNSLDTSDTNTEIRRLERQLAEKESLLEDGTTQIADLKELLRKLGTELNEAKMSAMSIVDVSSLQGERDILSTAFEEAKHTIAKLTERHGVHQDELQKANQKLEGVQRELEDVKALLQVQLDLNSDLQSSCTQKTEEIKTLTQKWQIAHNAVQELEKKMDSRLLDIQVLNAALEKLESDTRQKIALLETEVNEKNIYRAQMEEFKSNFEEEQRDRLVLKAEKVRLADELTRLQMTLEVKDDELQKLHRVHLQLASEHMNSEVTPANRPVNTSDEGAEGGGASGFTELPASAPPILNQSPPPELRCPLCSKGFSNQQALITHASSCGDGQAEAHSPSGFLFP